MAMKKIRNMNLAKVHCKKNKNSTIFKTDDNKMQPKT